ncbi:MAG TPA: lysophospholipid acyltransferase family protein [Candidatus Goldiibacteriota bacterium]|nr:lysophospholipid acyltransferase family protein [Candidatus Goldiibacteriota bacterium]
MKKKLDGIKGIISFWIVWINKVICIAFFKLFYFLRVKNADNVPKKGGLIIVANHSSYFDPPLIGIAAWRRTLKFMARSTLFIPGWGQFLKLIGSFPVKQGVIDRAAYNTLINYIRQGEAVVFFPEGTRSPDGKIQDGKAGSGMLIYKAGVKVLPVYIHNSWKAWPKGKMPRPFVPITVVFGEIMDFSGCFTKKPSKEIYVEITCKIIERLKKMQQDFLSKEAVKK